MLCNDSDTLEMCDEVTAQLTGVGVRDAYTAKLVIPLPHIVPPLHEFLLSVAHLVQIKERLRSGSERKLRRKSCQILSVLIPIHIPRWQK